MDFRYSPTEEQFRQEVKTWLEANVPTDLRAGGDEDLAPHDRWERQ